MLQNKMTGRQVVSIDLCYRHYLLARQEQETFPIVFENYCLRMNHLKFPQVSFIEITRMGNAAVGHLFMFVGEDEKTEFLNNNPQIKMLCQ